VRSYWGTVETFRVLYAEGQGVGDELSEAELRLQLSVVGPVSRNWRILHETTSFSAFQ